MCFLCLFHKTPLGKHINDFIIANIGYMDLHCISQQVSDFVLVKRPGSEGIAKDDVFAHIITHMLHPRVRMAVILRQLLEFACLLQNSMVVRDGELTTVDKGNAELYLKVTSHVRVLGVLIY